MKHILLSILTIIIVQSVNAQYFNKYLASSIYIGETVSSIPDDIQYDTIYIDINADSMADFYIIKTHIPINPSSSFSSTLIDLVGLHSNRLSLEGVSQTHSIVFSKSDMPAVRSFDQTQLQIFRQDYVDDPQNPGPSVLHYKLCDRQNSWSGASGWTYQYSWNEPYYIPLRYESHTGDVFTGWLEVAVDRINDQLKIGYISVFKGKTIYPGSLIDSVCPAVSNFSVAFFNSELVQIFWQSPPVPGLYLYGWLDGSNLIGPPTQSSLMINLPPEDTSVFILANVCEDSLRRVISQPINKVLSNPFVPNCPGVNTISSVTGTKSVKLQWEHDSLATQYIIRGKELSKINLTTYAVPGGGSVTSVNISGLLPATSYGWQIQRICNGSLSTWSDPDTFTTRCLAPTSLNTAVLTSTSATALWSGVPAVAGYRLYAKVSGSNNVLSYDMPASAISITNNSLQPSTTYLWAIQSICDASGSLSPLSSIDTFTTPVLKMGVVHPTGVFPNPAVDVLNIAGADKLSRLSLSDMLGRKVMLIDNIIPDQLDISGLKRGYYSITLESSSEENTYKVILK